jgi:hypothetical protein
MTPKTKTQLDRFKEAAREIGTDDDEAKFNENLGKLVKRKLTDEPESESMPPDGDES